MTALLSAPTATPLDSPIHRAFLDNFPGIWWIKDLQGRYLALSPSWESELGVIADDVIGRTPLDVFGPKAGQKMHDRALKVVAHGEPIEHYAPSPGHVWRSWEFLTQVGGRTVLAGAAISVFSAPRKPAPKHPFEVLKPQTPVATQ